MTGVTQPRHVVVLATTRRLAYQLGIGRGKEVGFQVRHDKKIGDSYAIKVMTASKDTERTSIEAILDHYIGEAQESSLNIDILTEFLGGPVLVLTKVVACPFIKARGKI